MYVNTALYFYAPVYLYANAMTRSPAHDACVALQCVAGDAQMHEGQLPQQGVSAPHGTKNLPPGVSLM